VKPTKTSTAPRVPSADETADDGEVLRIASKIMVEYRTTLEALAKSEAEDRENARKARSR
jgi:hypothetical protein